MDIQIDMPRPAWFRTIHRGRTIEGTYGIAYRGTDLGEPRAVKGYIAVVAGDRGYLTSSVFKTTIEAAAKDAVRKAFMKRRIKPAIA